MPLPIVVLISGSGSNLQAIIDAVASDRLPVEIRAVISNRPGVKGLERAQQAGIPTEVLDHNDHASREAFDKALQERIDTYEPQLVVLAGFMRLLTDTFVNHYIGRMLNIHPSLLPNFKGLNTHRRALEAYHKGEITEHGASVHFVTPDLDGGPVILQARVPIKDNDTPESLAARVLMVEHQIYPQTIQWFAEGRLHMQDHHAVLDGKTLDTPMDFDQLTP
jgi:phosphoribosylglycinamide formyltransferase-1